MPRRRGDQLAVYNAPLNGGGLVLPTLGQTWYVDTSGGSDTLHVGHQSDKAYATIGKAVTAAAAGDMILIAPGAYAESVTIPRTKTGLVLAGTGGRGAAFIEPSVENAVGMTVLADDVTLVNLGVAGEDSDALHALRIYGARFRAHQCKFESAVSAVILSPGTVAQQAALTHGDAADALFEDCEFCWGVNGIVFTSSDYGAVTQARVRRCYFHDLSGDHVDENDVAAIGAVRGLLVEDCTFMPSDEGVAPTKFLDLDSAGSTGLVSGCRFATTVFAAALMALAAGVMFVGNHAQAEGALATGGTGGRPD